MVLMARTAPAPKPVITISDPARPGVLHLGRELDPRLVGDISIKMATTLCGQDMPVLPNGHGSFGHGYSFCHLCSVASIPAPSRSRRRAN